MSAYVPLNIGDRKISSDWLQKVRLEKALKTGII